MKKYRLVQFGLYLCSALAACILFSCSSVKNVKYFQDIPDSGQVVTIQKAEYMEPKIQADDILSISVQTLDPKSTVAITAGNIPSSVTGTMAGANANQQQIAGYLVDKQGDVDIPILGKVHVAGLTSSQARDLIKQRADKSYNDATVIVRFVNFKISVTGEVARPGTYVVPNERVSILDAIAMAGDMTIFGKRDNILLIREQQDGTKRAYRFNITKSNLFTEPYYYLKQNDFIYIEPNKSKVASADANQARTIAIIGSALSVLIVLISRL